MSLLLVDAGNTRVKWATADRQSLQPAGDLPTAEATSEHLHSLAREYPGHKLVLASVVPAVTAEFLRAFPRRNLVVTGASKTLGLPFDYPKPAELGADRIAAAVRIHAEGTWPAIIVQCGTATAFNVLDEKGRFCGGAIAPGLQSQLTALLGATAQLPSVDLTPPDRCLARSTGDAIRAGLAYSHLGGVREILRRLTADLAGKRRPRIILTGGHAAQLSAMLRRPHTVRPSLVFEGLLIIGTRAWKTASP